jgi:hypothetical protein
MIGGGRKKLDAIDFAEAAGGCDKVGTTFSDVKNAIGCRSIAAFGSFYRE